jgi:hypothetical protein
MVILDRLQQAHILIARTEEVSMLGPTPMLSLHLVSWTNQVETAAGCPARQSPRLRNVEMRAMQLTDKAGFRLETGPAGMRMQKASHYH